MMVEHLFASTVGVAMFVVLFYMLMWISFVVVFYHLVFIHYVYLVWVYACVLKNIFVVVLVSCSGFLDVVIYVFVCF